MNASPVLSSPGCSRRQALVCTAGLCLTGGAQPQAGAGNLRFGAAGEGLRFSGGADANDQRYIYPRELLQLALARAGNPLTVMQAGGMNQARLAEEVAQGRMDVLQLPMSWPPNAAVMPVRVPLRRGLLGLRVLLARPAVAREIARVMSLDDLRTRFTMGYGADWIDRPAFTALGFKVVSGASYTGLFDMLRAGRFDFLSRGVNEVWAEIDHPSLGAGLQVVPGVALAYLLDDYFWVRAGNTALHDTIARGLALARADGSMAALMERWYGGGLRRAGLDRRRVFDVGGYPVEPGTPIELFDLLSTTVRSRRGS